jgi:hypothetical protein
MARAAVKRRISRGYVRLAATPAILLTVLAIALCDPSPVFAALSGLAAAAYLVLRYAAGMPGVVTATQPTVVGAVGFTCAGLAATSFPLPSPRLPLSAPVAAVGICTLATRPFWPTRSGRLG